MSRRRGFSLAELMVALVIAGVIGVALTRLVINQARFTASQDGAMRARSGARSALNALMYDLRQVSGGSVVAATPDSVTLRVPYAFGVACTQASGTTIVALLPPDSALYADARASGYVWRDSTGAWRRVEPATEATTSTAPCTGATPSIAVLSGPTRSYASALTPNDPATFPGALVRVYQNVRFAFAPSGQLSGRRALWRRVLSSGTSDELVVPFDSTAHFEFLVGPMLAPRTTAPSSLDSITGIRAVLVATSEQPPEGKTRPSTFTMTSDLVFRNHDYF
jgi:prepilin-type N-terminal cleavage/methylation domain-containing protein